MYKESGEDIYISIIKLYAEGEIDTLFINIIIARVFML